MKVYLHIGNNGELEVSTKDLSSETVIVDNAISSKKIKCYYKLITSWEANNDEEAFSKLSSYFDSQCKDSEEKIINLLAEFDIDTYDMLLAYIKDDNLQFCCDSTKEWVEKSLYREGFISQKVKAELFEKLELNFQKELDFCSSFMNQGNANSDKFEERKKLVKTLAMERKKKNSL